MSGRGRTPEKLRFVGTLALETLVYMTRAKEKMGIPLSESEAHELTSALVVLEERKNQRGI